MNHGGWKLVSENSIGGSGTRRFLLSGVLLVAVACSAQAQGPTTSMISPTNGATVAVGGPNFVWQSSGYGANTIKETWIQIDDGPQIHASLNPIPTGTSSGGFQATVPLGTYVNGPHQVFSYVKVVDGSITKSTSGVNFSLTGSTATTPPVGGGDSVTSIDPALLGKLNAALADQEKAIQALYSVVEQRYQAFLRLNAALKDVDAQISTARGQTSGSASTLPAALSALTSSLQTVQSANTALVNADKALDAATAILKDLQKQAGIALTGSSTQATLQRKQEQLIHDLRNINDVIVNLQTQDHSVTQCANDLAAATAAANQALATNQKSDRVEVQGDRLAILFYGPPLAPTLSNADKVYNKRIADATAERTKLGVRWQEIEKARTATGGSGTSGF